MPNQHQGHTVIPSDDLAASFRVENHKLVLPSTDIDKFLEQDLSLGRLAHVLPRLWLAGRPYPPRPLSVQKVLNRTTVATNDAALHLTWASGRIYLKPLPRYATSEAFHDQHLRMPKPNGLALGLILSYLALIPTELDFALARENHLLPSEYQWSEWRALVARVLNEYPGDTIYRHVHTRYVYGELRYDRLDKVYRFLHRDWLHGFSHLMGSKAYGDFARRHLGSIATATIYIVLALTAMQVVLALPSKPAAFISASYAFAIFAILAPLALIVLVLVLLACASVENWLRTTKAGRKRFDELGIESPEAAGRGIW